MLLHFEKYLWVKIGQHDQKNSYNEYKKGIKENDRLYVSKM